MGLLDDASNILNRRAQQEAAQQAAADDRKHPWSADWTHELAGLLRQKRIPPVGVYFDGGRTGKVNDTRRRRIDKRVWRQNSMYNPRIHEATYWCEGWALRGWEPGSFNLNTPVDVLLDTSGNLWDVMSKFQLLRKWPDGWVQDSGGFTEVYPDVHPEHQPGFFLVSDYQSAGNLRRATRDFIGVPVAVAVMNGASMMTGMILGVEP